METENNDRLQLIKLDFNGMKMLMQWAEEEGWNPGLCDADIFWKTDPNGYYGYYLQEKLIAGGAIISYDKAFGFMGLFIVSPEYRSLGIGRKLWHQRRNFLLSRLNKNASIGMDGVVAMQSFYNKGGFEIAFRDERYEKTGEPFAVDHHIADIAEQNFNTILSYDKKCFGFPRPQFMIPWLKQPLAKKFQYLDGGILKGFAVVRKTVKGYKIGPLFADNETVAEELYKACLNSVAGESVYLDIPLNNPGAVNLVRKYNAAYVFECARMYSGKAPETETGKVFGLTTFELG